MVAWCSNGVISSSFRFASDSDSGPFRAGRQLASCVGGSSSVPFTTFMSEYLPEIGSIRVFESRIEQSDFKCESQQIYFTSAMSREIDVKTQAKQ